MSENLFVIVGPSAVGKNAILDILRKYPYHGRVEELVSATTRPPRCGERDGVDYRFVSRREFEELRRGGMLAEWVEFEGNMYGTPIDILSAPSSLGTVKYVAIVDTAGAVVLKEKLGSKATTVFIMPPSEAALEERFRKRSAYDGEDLSRRMARARNDMGMAEIFDHVVVNDDIDRAAVEVATIMGLVEVKA